jgi:hypothetical protein
LNLALAESLRSVDGLLRNPTFAVTAQAEVATQIAHPVTGVARYRAPATQGTAIATRSETAPMASNSHPVISVLASDRANQLFTVTQTAGTMAGHQMTRGEGLA